MQRYLRRPIRSLQTMLRLLSRSEDVYASVIPDGIYGPVTAAAVSAFQEQARLPVTGVTDYATWNRIVSAYLARLPGMVLPAPILIRSEPQQCIAPGEKNSHVYLAQSMLRVLGESYRGVPDVDISGTLDEKSVRCLLWLQKKSGLPENGVLDAVTWQHLTKLYDLISGNGS